MKTGQDKVKAKTKGKNIKTLIRNEKRKENGTGQSKERT